MLRRLIRRALGGAPRHEPAPQPEGVRDASSLAHIKAGVQELIERMACGEEVDTLDVRDVEDFAKGHLPGARSIPFDQLSSRWEEVANSDEIVCYSQTGERSRQAATLLRERGVFNATSLEGGLAAWRALSGPVEI